MYSIVKTWTVLKIDTMVNGVEVTVLFGELRKFL